MKKTLSVLLLLSFALMLFAPSGYAETPPPKLYLNGEIIETDSPPFIKSNSTFVPIAVLSSNLGYTVGWDNTLKQVTVANESTVIELVIGQAAIKINNETRETNVAAMIQNERTMVPIRLVGELLGLTFQWDQQEKAVYMMAPPPPAPDEETETPAEPQRPGYINGIVFDGQSVIYVAHDGASKPGVQKLTSPDRIVFDFYNTSLSESMPKGLQEIAVPDNGLLSAYRYAQFDATTARVVIVVGEDTGHYIAESEGLYAIMLMPKAEVPAQPEPPVDPEQPSTEEPGVPADGKVYHVVIDAGHGGSDPGALSKSLNRWEKEFNLAVALKLQAILEKDARIKVHMTRTDDTYPTLDDRIAFAEALKADLFLSIHANSFDKPTVTGTETYYERPESKAFAEVIHKHMLAATGLTDRGVKKAAYKVIKNTTMPAVLVEAGYLSNESDAKKLFSEDVQNKIAAELAAGIKEYLNLK